VKILDTDHYVAILRGQLDVRRRVTPGDELAITAMTIGELVHGAHRSARASANLRAIDNLLSLTTVLSFDDAAGRIFGKTKAQLQWAGAPIEDLDLQIASIALHHDALLVTHNQKHFKRVPELKLEDWLA
jgi:tRNA(fMet)-specific endonuclease VapC